jgi:hypothetical protein
MILEVSEFRKRVVDDLPTLVTELQAVTGRSGDEEATAWSNSLPRLARAFSSKGFDHLHLYFNGSGALSLEYQLPAASSWCDVVLLGRSKSGPGAVIIELKHWQTHGDMPGQVEGLVQHLGQSVLHPSDQVRGYVEYCRRFHSAVLDSKAVVNGCVLFTQNTNTNAYRLPPNDDLASAYPCFSFTDHDLSSPFPSFVIETITSPDFEFATSFERGTYKQDRGFVRQIGEQILSPEKEGPFVLLDNQRRAFALCRAQVNSSLFHQGNTAAKKVIIIEGPPGSGKSVVAAKIWAALATDQGMPEGPIVFTSTSASQNSNWSHLFARTAGTVAGAGVVKKATSYTPITTHRLGALRGKHGGDFMGDAGDWRDHLKTLRALGIPFQRGSCDGEYLVSVVDEAHALINPEHVEGRGQFGFVTGLGPQGYHIIRVSQVTIFLLDERQSFRTRENTTVADLRNWAAELGAELYTVSLAGSQFRCAGSKEYVDWVEAVLRGDPPDTCRVFASAWLADTKTSAESGVPANIISIPESTAKVAEDSVFYKAKWQKPSAPGALDFRIFDTPQAMEDTLRTRLSEGHTARLLAPYARPWTTKGATKPHDLPARMKDFQIPNEGHGGMETWERVWNFVPGNGSDYATFIQGKPGSRIHDDPLCEVGCPYAVRGFDWDYIGILWLSDLVIDRQNRWFADPSHVYESGISTLTSRAKNELDANGPHHQNLFEAVAQCYRILLTRPIRGVYLWFEHQATRHHIESTLSL